jgi:hypothetical protein
MRRLMMSPNRVTSKLWTGLPHRSQVISIEVISLGPDRTV